MQNIFFSYLFHRCLRSWTAHYWLDLSRIAWQEQEQRDAFEIMRLLTKGRHRMKKEAINGEMDASRRRLVRSKSAHLPHGMRTHHIKTCNAYRYICACHDKILSSCSWKSTSYFHIGRSVWSAVAQA